MSITLPIMTLSAPQIETEQGKIKEIHKYTELHTENMKMIKHGCESVFRSSACTTISMKIDRTTSSRGLSPSPGDEREHETRPPSPREEIENHEGNNHSD